MDLQEIEAIKRLKYRYLRCLDCKLWDEMADCFTEDAATGYADGRYRVQGRDAILRFLRKGLPSTRVTMHHVHNPEIEITGQTTAKGTWALEDYVIDLAANVTASGAAFYHDEYIKVNEGWKIRHTAYQHVFRETWDRREMSSLKLTENMHEPPRDRSHHD